MKTNRLLKTALRVLFCAFASFSALAQAENKWYVKAYGYYGLLTPGGFRGQGAAPSSTYTSSSAGTYYTTRTNSSNYKVENSFGSGLRVGGGIGYVVNDFLNLGVDGEYVLGNTATETYDITNETTTSGIVTPAVNYKGKVKLEYDYRIINIIPNITFKAVSKPQYYIYNRLGLVVGIPTQLNYTLTSVYSYPGSPSSRYEEKTDYELEKSMGIGYQAALGVQFRIGDNLRGFAEIVLSSLQLKSNSSTITQGEYSYSDATTSQLNQPIEYDDESRKKNDLNLGIPVSSVGLGIGLAFRF